MNRYKEVNTEDTGGFPFDLGTIKFMQDGFYEMIKGLCTAFGENVILSGVEEQSGNFTSGYVIYNGELLPFVSGPVGSQITVMEQETVANFDDLVERTIETTRTAISVNSGGVNLNNFRRLSNLLQGYGWSGTTPTPFTDDQMVPSGTLVQYLVGSESNYEFFFDAVNAIGKEGLKWEGWGVYLKTLGDPNTLNEVNQDNRFYTIGPEEKYVEDFINEGVQVLTLLKF